jgi:DNA-binding NarL/FixJ family response regulator
MSGMDFYQEVARVLPEVASRIIFLSGGANAELATAFFAAIPNIALQKPPSPPELLGAIEARLIASGRGTLAGAAS